MNKTENRFLEKIKKMPNGCWEWQGVKDGWGYGGLRYLGKMTKAHRVSWKLYRGEIPAGIFVCHHCDNPPCVNPEHLFLGTHQDNVDDSVKKGRQAHGQSHPVAKLKDSDISRIFELRAKGWPVRKIAAEVGLKGERTVWVVLRGMGWRHVAIENRAIYKATQKPKLTNETVFESLRLRQSGMICQEIANRLGVHRSIIYRICRGETYQHVTGLKYERVA